MTTYYKTLLGGLLIAFLATATPMFAANNNLNNLNFSAFNSNPERDTIIIKFGKNSQIVLYIDNKKDLEKISQYDINQMLKDLNMSISEMDDSTKVLTIEDETGSKYLTDTTIIITKIEPQTNWDDDEWDSYSSTSEESKKRYNPRPQFYFNIDIGLGNYLEDGKFPNGNEPYALNPIGSWYWAFGPTFRTHLFGAFFMDLGMNAALNVYRFDDPRTRLNKTPTGIEFALDNSAVAFEKSKLSTWHIQAKAIPMVLLGSKKRNGWRLWNNVDKGFRFGLGPYAGYRIWSRTKYIYRDNGDKKKDKNNGNFLLNNIRYGLRGQIGIRGIDLFVEYDMSDMFQDNSGAPALQRIQFGITL
ncbi:MAG: hypothetical protein L3J06_05255 [Cyclobacteriaceae bacterium]|nr:hypothetical protein [Cyclobacteriaceae bacterium]